MPRAESVMGEVLGDWGGAKSPLPTSLYAGSDERCKLPQQSPDLVVLLQLASLGK